MATSVKVTSNDLKTNESLIPKASENFYLHVNKKWLDDPTNQIPSEYPRWGGFVKLADDGLKNQIELVKELREKTYLTEEETKISAIWEASDKRFKDWENGTGDYQPVINELVILDTYLRPKDPINDPEDLVERLSQYFYYSQVNGIGNVLDFDKGEDLKNSNNVLLDISISGTSLPSRDYYTEDSFLEKRTMFKNHLNNVAELLGDNVKQTYLGPGFAENVTEFEHILAYYQMTPAQSRNYPEYFNSTTLTHFLDNINEMKSVGSKQENYKDNEKNYTLDNMTKQLTKQFFESVYQLFEFRKVLKSNRLYHFFGEATMYNPPDEEALAAYDGDGIRRVIGLILNPENFDKYRSFLQYKVISSFKGYCTKGIDEEYFDFYSRKLSGTQAQKSNDKRSIQMVNGLAGEMMGKVYVKKYFSEKSKQDIKQMIDEVLDIMKQSIGSNDWLTESTKEKALLKLCKFNVKIGYPDVWKDYSGLDIKQGDDLYTICKKVNTWGFVTRFMDKLNTVTDRTEWGMTPQTVNAYFDPCKNEIVFPAAILQPPFYNPRCQDIDFDITEESKNCSEEYCRWAANFGGIGAVIAHEITHGYDDKGREFDGNGNVNDWWTPRDDELFKGKTDIMTEQAKQYVFTDTDDNKQYTMDPELTMGENLADLGGMSLAIKGLKRKIESDIDERLGSYDYRDAYRVFFKSFANIWKQNTKKDFRIMCLTSDPHAPADFRANMVKNIDQFYPAFDVKENDPMYLPPSKRVKMW